MSSFFFASSTSFFKHGSFPSHYTKCNCPGRIFFATRYYATNNAATSSQESLRDALRFIEDEKNQTFRIEGIKAPKAQQHHHHNLRGRQRQHEGSSREESRTQEVSHVAEASTRTSCTPSVSTKIPDASFTSTKTETSFGGCTTLTSAEAAASAIANQVQAGNGEDSSKLFSPVHPEYVQQGSPDVALTSAFPSTRPQILRPSSDKSLSSSSWHPMTSPQQRNKLESLGYETIGSHSAIKLCRWTKNALKARGQCYKHTFYGINSHQCMEMTPSLACANKCVFCWRNHQNPVTKKWKYEVDDPQYLLDEALKKHETKFLRQVLSGLRERADPVRVQDLENSLRGVGVVHNQQGQGAPEETNYNGLHEGGALSSIEVDGKQSQEQHRHPAFASTSEDGSSSASGPLLSASSTENPFDVLDKINANDRSSSAVRHCALSLVGEPVLYPRLPELLERMYAKRISTFLVTNGQFPDSLAAVPERYCTQLYCSVDAGTEEKLRDVGRPLFSDAFTRMQKSLEILREKRCRTVLRLTYLLPRGRERGSGANKLGKTSASASLSLSSELSEDHAQELSDAVSDAADEYASVLQIAEADFIEVKGATYAPEVFSKTGLTQAHVPTHSDVIEFASAIQKRLPAYGLACEHHHSCGVLLARKDRWLRQQHVEHGTTHGDDTRTSNMYWRTWIDFDKMFDLTTSNDSPPNTSVDTVTVSSSETNYEKENAPFTALSSCSNSTKSSRSTTSTSFGNLEPSKDFSVRTPEFALFGSKERGLNPRDRMRRSGCRPDDNKLVEQLSAAASSDLHQVESPHPQVVQSPYTTSTAKLGG
ncbi:unnamed protein product [Amoebophrya sp. A25]|nr:unnamed protein product [Amoebophrya sp. A25]|eukprot:GSA25T00011135001.1